MFHVCISSLKTFFLFFTLNLKYYFLDNFWLVQYIFLWTVLCLFYKSQGFRHRRHSAVGAFTSPFHNYDLKKFLNARARCSDSKLNRKIPLCVFKILLKGLTSQTSFLKNTLFDQNLTSFGTLSLLQTFVFFKVDSILSNKYSIRSFLDICLPFFKCLTLMHVMFSGCMSVIVWTWTKIQKTLC